MLKQLRKQKSDLGQNVYAIFKLPDFWQILARFCPKRIEKMPRSLGHLQFLSSRAIAEASQDTKKIGQKFLRKPRWNT